MEEMAGNVGTEGPPSAPRIGPYRIVRELGRGGMGTVYLCEDTAVGDRLVALKVLHDPRTGGVEMLERFRREIRNLGVLRHPNIVQVLYAGEHEGHPYFVMEYVRGRELHKWLEEAATLPEPERIAAIVGLMAKVARGVAHAHGNGTIHRDLKPQNILVREDGEPLVLDFGIAKHREDTTLTASASTPGTPSHMAPEQFEPALILKEELVDVWALGTILYQALTRERPFRGHSLASVSYQIVHGKPTGLRKLNAHVPPMLEDLVLKCLEKDPRKRPQGAQKLAESLDRALGDVVHSAQARRKRAVVVVGVAALIIAVLAVRPWTWGQNGFSAADLRPVVEEVAGAPVDPRDREITVPAYQVKVRIRFGESAAGATLEAVLTGADPPDELDRALLAPAGGGAHEAFLKVPALRQHPGMRATIALFANGELLAAALPALVFAPEPETRPPAPEPRASEEPVVAPAPMPAPDSRAESAASSRVAAPELPPLPEVWATITVGKAESRTEGPVQLKPGETTILVASKIDRPVKKWTLRLIDATGAVVTECDLEPVFGSRTLAGKLKIGSTNKNRTLTGVLSIVDSDGTTKSQPLRSPQFCESIQGLPKPVVRLELARGNIKLELDRALSPLAVEAFLDHVRAGDYDGCIFHEVSKSQLVKAGLYGPGSQLKGAPPGPPPADWVKPKSLAPNLSVAMIGPAEFEIHLHDNESMGSAYRRMIQIGRVIEGSNVLDAIEGEAVTDSGDLKRVPVTPVVILKAVVEGEIGETR